MVVHDAVGFCVNRCFVFYVEKDREIEYNNG